MFGRVVAFLLASSTPVDVRTDDGTTPFHLAAWQGHEALVDSLGVEADNVSFLHQMFEKIKQHCDPVDDDEFRFQLLSQTGQKCLKKMIKNPDNIKPYPGTIFLPAQLFKERSAESMAEDRDDADADADDDRIAGKHKKSSKPWPNNLHK